MTELVRLLLVFLAFAVVYTVPAWRVASRLIGGGWPFALLTSIVLGTGTQALAGLLMSRRPGGGSAWFEFLAYLSFWALVNVVLLFRGRRAGRASARLAAGRESLQLALVLAAAVLVRSVHPLRHMALGQSDAYMHLTFLRDVLQAGRLHNPVYPPGFSWILALPTGLFRLDPYVVCRFGGAFFGASLVLAVYVLLRSRCGRGAALASAFLVACFPGLSLLIKTGVGVFPNQYGLLLLPVILFFALESAGEDFSLRGGRLWLFVLSLAFLAATVPMMLPHVTLVLLFSGLLSLFVPGVPRASLRAPLALIAGPVLLLVLVNFSAVDTRQIIKTFDHVIAGSRVRSKYPTNLEDVQEGRGLLLLRMYADDYLSVKRRGFASPLLNGAVGAAGLAFAAMGVFGVAGGGGIYRLIGVWGLLGVLHVLFGIMQFTAYQREGWSMLIAGACLGGIVLSRVLSHAGNHPAAAPLGYGAAAAVLLFSLSRPPGHLFLNSATEEEIVRLVRGLERDGDLRSLGIGGPDQDGGKWLAAACGSRKRWTIVSRRFPQQGVLRSLVGRGGSFHAVEVKERTDLGRLFAPPRCYIIILDDAKAPDAYRLGVMGQVSPGLLQSFTTLQRHLGKINDRLAGHFPVLEEQGWRIAEIAGRHPLRVVLAVKPRPGRVKRSAGQK